MSGVVELGSQGHDMFVEGADLNFAFVDRIVDMLHRIDSTPR